MSIKLTQTTILKISSLLVLLLAVMGLTFLIFNNIILATHPAGLIIQVLAVGLMIWARVIFGIRSFHAAANTTKGRLVTNGPYRWLRHPIYAAIIYFVWAGVLSHIFIDAIAAVALITVCLIIRMFIEEQFLMTAYDEYRAYSKLTFRLIPFLF